MADGSALFAAILAAPDDDAPRLVYADWLDEQGRGDGADLIRVQCGLAGLKTPVYPAFAARSGIIPCECPLGLLWGREARLLYPTNGDTHPDRLRADWAGEPVWAQAESWR
jgi:uncharacterized protein (TIGR02996 family)